MFRSLFGSSSKKKSATKGSRRLELLEPRLALSGLPWQTPTAPVVAAGPTISLSPTADASVYGLAPYTNYGNTTDLLVQNDSNSWATNDAESYLRFNTSSVAGTISKATLTLTPLSLGSGDRKLVVGVQLLQAGEDTSWIEGTGGTNYALTGPMTWNNSPSGAGQVATVAGSQFAVDAPVSINVTSLLQQNFSTNGVASFIVGAVSWYGRNQMVDFASRENSTAAYRPTLSITLAGPVVPPPTVAQPLVVSQTSTTAKLSVTGSDSSTGANLVYTWSTASAPAGAPSPTFSTSGADSPASPTVAFGQAGTYTFTATVTNKTDGLSTVSSPVTVTIGQTLKGIQVTPAAATVAVGTTQTFAALGVDQFGKTMPAPSGVTWTWSGAGTYSPNSSTCVYTAPTKLGTTTTATVYATSGSYQAGAGITLVTSFYGIMDPTLSSLTQSLDARDGAINRADMIQILQKAATLNGGAISQSEMTDLKTLLGDAAVLNIPGYVQVLADDVINGNPANAHYQGQAMGNLAAGSSGTHLDDLVSKWFLGTDLPATGGYGYSAVTGPLWGSSGPSHLDEDQGYLGDCYLISSLGSIADSSPAAIENMIVANGDGTWTVRFYDNGKADYVTVNDMLPTSGGTLIFDGYGYGATNPSGLWIALIEKAYAQWDETGNEGRGNVNSYTDIEGGWMADVDAQVLGHAAASYNVYSSSDQQALISGVTNKQAVTIGTDSSNNSNDTLSYGLYGGHAYAVVGYNASSQTFTLYNPWGIDQPQALTWSQLTATCDGFVVANPAGTQSFGASPTTLPPTIAPRPAAAEASAGATVSVAATAGSTSDESQAVNSVLAASTVGPSSDDAAPVSQASVNRSIDSALQAINAMLPVAGDANVQLSGHLRAAAVDCVFEAI